MRSAWSGPIPQCNSAPHVATRLLHGRRNERLMILDMWAAARCCHRTARGNRVSTRAEVTDDVLERTGLLGSRLAFAQLRSWVGGQISRVGGWYWVLPVALSFVVTAVGASRPTLWNAARHLECGSSFVVSAVAFIGPRRFSDRTVLRVY